MVTVKNFWGSGSFIFDFSSDALVHPTTNRFKRTGKRDQIFLATKFGVTPQGANGTPKYVRSAVESSLNKLGVDTIDLYYIHVSNVVHLLNSRFQIELLTLQRIDQTVPIEVCTKVER